MPNNDDVNVALNKILQRYYRPNNSPKDCACCYVYCCVFLLHVIPDTFFSYPSISLTVNAFVDLTQNQSANGISPFFNFTLDVKRPRSSFVFRPEEYCYGHGYITVFHKGFQIAKGEVEGYCVHKDGRQATMLFSWGKDVEMPDLIHNLLVEEVRNGEAEVEVDLNLSDGSKMLWICRAKTRTMEMFNLKLMDMIVEVKNRA